MHEPIVFVVDEDPRALGGLTSVLQRRFGGDYRILADGDPGSAEVTLAEACDGGAPGNRAGPGRHVSPEAGPRSRRSALPRRRRNSPPLDADDSTAGGAAAARRRALG